MQASKPSSSTTQAHFSGPPATPTTWAPWILPICPTSEPTEPRRGRDQQGLARLRCPARSAGRGRRSCPAMPSTESRWVSGRWSEQRPTRARRRGPRTPASRARRAPGRRAEARASATPPPRRWRSRASRRPGSTADLVGGALHPGAVGRVQGEQHAAHQHLAVARARASGAWRISKWDSCELSAGAFSRAGSGCCRPWGDLRRGGEHSFLLRLRALPGRRSGLSSRGVSA